MNGSPAEVPIGLMNIGAGVAQIDSYQLLFISEDDPENGRGSEDPPSDLRYIGYRVLPVFETDCEYLLEFAITTWERTQRLYIHHFEVVLDIDGDFEPDWILYNTGPIFGSDSADCRLIELITEEEKCTGFVVDHSTNTANTVLRVCSNDLGISEPQIINMGVVTYSYPEIAKSDATTLTPVLFPDPALAAPSYDVLPGRSLDNILVSGPGRVQNRAESLGLLLFTNAYRDASSTGAATRETEAVVILRSGINDPFEVTPDFQQLPVTTNKNGPTGCSWVQDLPSVCPLTTFSIPGEFETLVDATTKTLTLRNTTRHLQALSCAENIVPRANVILATPSPTPPPTMPVTPTPTVSLSPTRNPSSSSSAAPARTTSGVLLQRPYGLATVAVSLLFAHAAFA
jgi:hypothetical protein